MIFYILKNIPSIEADTAKDAARKYALQEGIVAGTITVVTGTKKFNMENTPRDVRATEV